MDSNTLLLILGMLLFIVICVLVYFIYSAITKEEYLKTLTEENKKIVRSFNDLDEQARLIVRTDLELTKAREEMDKRLNALNALQRSSRQISQALSEAEIFQRLTSNLFEDLGFARALIVTRGEDRQLKVRLNLSYKQQRLDMILKEIEAEDFINTQTHFYSSNNSPTKIRERIIQIFEAEFFVLAPVLTQNGNLGLVFVGNRYNASMVTQGDEELITILAGQIGQSIENARLFEKVFRSSQELELKVSERTKQLAAALEQVNQISRKKSEFISAVSHELRTPLTSIKGYAAILIAGKIGELPVAVKERLAKINTHSDNLVGLINNLLDIARIESGRQEMKFGLYKVKSVVENVADLLTPQVTAKGVKLQINVPETIDEIYIDVSQAERVFINLLSNATKFTPAQGAITIAVAEKLDQGFATFSVADTGIGIPEADLKKLFSEFFRVDNEINQHVKGTGLGLVLAKNIVQAHHGKMWVESKVGVGTSFFFTLPVSAEAFGRTTIEIEKINAP